MASDRRRTRDYIRSLLERFMRRRPGGDRRARPRVNSSILRGVAFQEADVDARLSDEELLDELPGDEQVPLSDTKAPGAVRTRKILRSVKLKNMSWHDHLVMLLHVAAGIEHALMVQYLYASYSMTTAGLSDADRRTVRRWRDSILAVAKEEMGHLLTVQNILTFIGGTVSLDRADFPWDARYYPFPFRLEPLTLESLSCYVYAEMPTVDEIAIDVPREPRYEPFLKGDLDAMSKVVELRDQTPHRVGMLYAEIIAVLKRSDRVPDSWLRRDSVAWQATSEEWGRGSSGGLRADTKSEADERYQRERPGALRRDASYYEANVVIKTVGSREEAIAALEQISAQGEGPHGPDTTEPSHFDRFLEIYQDYMRLGCQRWPLSGKVAINPTTFHDEEAGNDGTFIGAKYARRWAYLFNLRYRLLLTFLAHSLRLTRITAGDRPNVRAMVMHRIFMEMYNLKSIAGLIVRLPLRSDCDDTRAGPPFEMPYTTRLPADELDCWDLYLDMLATSARLRRRLLKRAKQQADEIAIEYLARLRDMDKQSHAWVKQIRSDVCAYQRRFP